MRNIPPDFVAHLDGNATTLCRCWKITRRDGEVLGFTDHDTNVTVGVDVYEPMSGLDASVGETSIGLNADSVEVLGALTSQKLSSADIRADKYDGAQVEIYTVNWTSPEELLLENIYQVGEITEEEGLFKAELRTLESQLDQTIGDHYIRQCQADLGDNRCQVDVLQTTFSGAGSVTSYDGLRQLTVSGLGAFLHQWFEGGLLSWTSGENAGTSIEISQHIFAGNLVQLELWKMLPGEITSGDNFDIVAGCNKEFSTCKFKFGNPLNFRGFPHLPGNNFALSYASNSKKLDGGILVK